MKNEIIELISKTLGISKKKITEKTNLTADLDVESLDLVSLVVAFEQKYNIEIPDQDIKNLQTVEDIIKYIESHV
ncbi:MAG: acyl carrier protein [Bacilli bacterium]|nr:acyl carrier protein [Bacilli bacterium]